MSKPLQAEFPPQFAHNELGSGQIHGSTTIMVSVDDPPLFTDVASRNRNQRIAARDQDTPGFSDRGRAVNQATLECFQTDVQVKKVARIRKVLRESKVEPERGEAVSPSLEGAWRN